jgi:hypothetical protein
MTADARSRDKVSQVYRRVRDLLTYDLKGKSSKP